MLGSVADWEEKNKDALEPHRRTDGNLGLELIICVGGLFQTRLGFEHAASNQRAGDVAERGGSQPTYALLANRYQLASHRDEISAVIDPEKILNPKNFEP